MSILLLLDYLDKSLSLKQIPPPNYTLDTVFGNKVSPFGFDLVLSEYVIIIFYRNTVDIPAGIKKVIFSS